jgi:NAD(P)-dependent dehydrogenase (short-subunit alcohol dehydrogenase family)
MAKALVGQSALVTGGGRGIGRAIAERLAAQGAAVTVVSRTERQIQEVAAAIEQAGGQAQAIPCDVTDRASVERAVKAAEDRFGPLSFLVNSAGQGGPYGPIGVADPDEWWAAQAVHVRGPMLFMSAAMPGMRARKTGRILNICSIGGTLKSPNVSAYGVGKCAEIRLTEYADAEGKLDGVRAFAVQPGTILTDLALETINSPVAQKYLPWMIEMLGQVSAEDSARALRRCAEISALIATGRYDVLAGRYIDYSEDLDALARQIAREPAPTHH